MIRKFSSLLLSLPLAAGLLCAASSAPAQTSASGDIPFEFIANNLHFAAGNYEVQLMQDGILRVRDLDRNKSAFLRIREELNNINNATDPGSKLVFQIQRGGYYLTEVWISGRVQHSNLVGRPKLEREFAMQTKPADFPVVFLAMK